MKVYSGRAQTKQKKKWYIPIVISALVLVLGIQLINLYTRLSDYRQREIALELELQKAEAASKDLADYEAYTQSDEFIKNIARSKLGMINDNEIIFKEN